MTVSEHIDALRKLMKERLNMIAQSSTSFAVYGIMTGSPVVPEEEWIRTIFSSGAVISPSG